MAGTTDKVKGAVEEGAGKLTGDKRTEAAGKADRAEGEVQCGVRLVQLSSGHQLGRCQEQEVVLGVVLNG